jgi:hypothetical protein
LDELSHRFSGLPLDQSIKIQKFSFGVGRVNFSKGGFAGTWHTHQDEISGAFSQ